MAQFSSKASRSEALIDWPLVFSDLALIKSRPAFDEQCSVTVENVEVLLSEYHSTDWATCQVEHDGSRCEHEFQNGWLARRRDGKEGLIGRVCGAKYFNASETFRVARNLLSRQIRIESHLTALTQLMSDKPVLAARHAQADERLRNALKVLRKLKQELPSDVVRALRDMVKTGNATVFVEVQFIETDEKGEQRTSWQRRDVGGVVGLAAWEENIALGMFAALGGVEDALNHAVISRDQKEADLRRWREALEALLRCEEEVARFDRAMQDFNCAENIGLLCHLVANHDEQRNVMRLLLLAEGEPNPSKLRVQTRLNEIHAQARRQLGDRNFRVAH